MGALGRLQQQRDQPGVNIVAYHQHGARCQQGLVLRWPVLAQRHHAAWQHQLGQPRETAQVGIGTREAHQLQRVVIEQSLNARRGDGGNEKCRINTAIGQRLDRLFFTDAEQIGRAMLRVQSIGGDHLHRHRADTAALGADRDGLAGQLTHLGQALVATIEQP